MSNNVYDRRDLVHVSPYSGTQIRYGFKTNVNQERRAALGHTAIAAEVPAGMVIGANSPKPGRASRLFADGYASSFFDHSKAGELLAAGWTVGAGRSRGGGDGLRSRTFYVTLGGIKYGWTMPSRLATLLAGDLSELGIQSAAANEDDLVFGSQRPKPPRASKRTIGDGGTTVLSTFYDPSRTTLPDTWNVVNKGRKADGTTW